MGWLVLIVVILVGCLMAYQAHEADVRKDRQQIYEQRQREEAARRSLQESLNRERSSITLSECYANFAQMVRAIRTTEWEQKSHESLQRAWIDVYYQRQTGLFDVRCGYDACTNGSVKEAFETGRIEQHYGLERVDEGILYNVDGVKGIMEEFSNDVIFMFFHKVNPDAKATIPFEVLRKKPDMNSDIPWAGVSFGFEN